MLVTDQSRSGGFDVAVIGGGVIGSAIAWRLARAGSSVALVDPGMQTSASWVAGGMLAPVAEAWPGEEDLLALGVDSLTRWPRFAGDLLDAGHDPGLSEHGTVVLAGDAADREVLVTLADYLGSHGHKAELMTGRELRRVEPAVGPAVRAGLSVPGDPSVDNRALLRALRAAGEAAGVVTVTGRAVTVNPLELAGGGTVEAAVTVLAAGSWSGQLHPALAHLVRPVKGEVLRLRPRPGSLPPPARTVRGLVAGRPVYLVPRASGEVVLGATQYEAGFDTEPVAGGVRHLLADAERLVPAVSDYAVAEVAAGLRAGSADNMPVIGWLEPGVLAATGHHRNGLLLAPVTADAVLSLLDGNGLPAVARAADIKRFGGRREGEG